LLVIRLWEDPDSEIFGLSQRAILESGEKFVQFTSPENQIAILFFAFQAEQMKKIASKKTPIHFDTTFNIGEFYVSFFCFPDTNLYGIEFLSPNITLLHLTFSLLLLCTGNPAKFGPVFVHQKRDEHCYSTLFSQILCMDREFRNEVFFHILHV